MGKNRALHRYKHNGVYRGKKISREEIMRRVEQSLLATGKLVRAEGNKHKGQLVTGVSTTPTQQSEAQGSTEFVENPTQKLKDQMKDADKGTITIS